MDYNTKVHCIFLYGHGHICIATQYWLHFFLVIFWEKLYIHFGEKQYNYVGVQYV